VLLGLVLLALLVLLDVFATTQLGHLGDLRVLLLLLSAGTFCLVAFGLGFLGLHRARFLDADDLAGLVVVVAVDALHHFHDILASLDTPKHDMLAVEPRSLLKSDKKLGAVRVGAAVG